MNQSASNSIPITLQEGQVIVMPMFRQPMRVIGVESDGDDAWIVWLAGTHSHQSRCIRVDRDEVASFFILGHFTAPVTPIAKKRDKQRQIEQLLPVLERQEHGWHEVLPLQNSEHTVTPIPIQHKRQATGKCIKIQPQQFANRRVGLLKDSAYVYPDPPCGSVLLKTVPDLFGIVSEIYDALWRKADEIFTEELILGDDDWRNLARNGIFKEDNLSIILSTSMNYFYQAKLSNEGFVTIINRIRAMIQKITQVMPVWGINASDAPIFTCQAETKIHNLRLDSFAIPARILSEIKHTNAVTWGDLSAITEKSIIHINNLSWRSIEQIAAVRHLNDYAYDIITMLNETQKGVRFGCFEEMIKTSILATVKHQQENDVTADDLHEHIDLVILNGRLGLLGGQVKTLEELSVMIGLTRERIRQRYKESVSLVRDRVPLFWMVVREELLMTGGACVLEELSPRVARKMKWRTTPSPSQLFPFFSINDDIVLDSKTETACLSLCANCGSVRASLQAFLENTSGEVPIEEVAEFVKLSCSRKYSCKNNALLGTPSEAFVKLLIPDGIIIEDGVVFHSGTRGAKRGSVIQMIESELLEANGALHFAEICNRLQHKHSTDKNISERCILGALVREERFVLWGRGAYIHQSFVYCPEPIIGEIYSWLVQQLKETRSPFMSVAGTYYIFSKRLSEAGIPSSHALYSCLQRSKHSGMDFPKYPRVVLFGTRTLSVTAALEKFVLKAGSLIPVSQVIEYGENKLGMSHVSQKIQNVPNLVFAGNGLIIHSFNLPDVEGKVDDIISYAKSLLELIGHVSVKKVFEGKKITCMMLEISSSEMLYAVLKVYAVNDLFLPRYPQISTTSNINKDHGVIDCVVQWVASQCRPCALNEIGQYFGEKLGYSETTVNAVTAKESSLVVRYSRGAVIHISTIAWDEEKQERLNTSAREIFTQASNTGKCYALVSNLIESVSLPVLENNIVWTPTLLGELLERDGGFYVLGTARNAYVTIPNCWGILTLEDLLYEILKDPTYKGACLLKQFEADMRNAGVTQELITPSMLDDQSKVCIHGQLIMLRELCPDA